MAVRLSVHVRVRVGFFWVVFFFLSLNGLLYFIYDNILQTGIRHWKRDGVVMVPRQPQKAAPGKLLKSSRSSTRRARTTPSSILWRATMQLTAQTASSKTNAWLVRPGTRLPYVFLHSSSSSLSRSFSPAVPCV